MCKRNNQEVEKRERNVLGTRSNQIPAEGQLDILAEMTRHLDGTDVCRMPLWSYIVVLYCKQT